MKILYIHQYFKTPDEGGAIRSWYIATAMVQAGHSVDMITATNKSEFKDIEVNGINVHYLPVKYDNSFGFIRRLRSFLNFSYRTIRYTAKLEKPDIAYITSTPLTVGLIALRLKKRLNLPYIFEVRDLWPEAPIQAGMIRSTLLKKIAQYLETRTYRNAEKLVALSPGIEAALLNQQTGIAIHLCTNMSDCGFFGITEVKDPELRKNYGIDGEFVIGYFGAIGKLNALEHLMAVAELANEKNTGIKILIIGNGAEKSKLEKIREERGLNNVIFIDHLDKYELRRHLTLIDAAYISFAPLTVLESNSPNKFFDALAAGKMVILNIKGWLKDHVEKSKCGFYSDPEYPDDIFKKLEPFLRDHTLLKQYQQNARRLAESDFEKDKLTAGLLKFIEEN